MEISYRKSTGLKVGGCCFRAAGCNELSYNYTAGFSQFASRVGLWLPLSNKYISTFLFIGDANGSWQSIDGTVQINKFDWNIFLVSFFIWRKDCK